MCAHMSFFETAHLSFFESVCNCPSLAYAHILHALCVQNCISGKMNSARPDMSAHLSRRNRGCGRIFPAPVLRHTLRGHTHICFGWPSAHGPRPSRGTPGALAQLTSTHICLRRTHDVPGNARDNCARNTVSNPTRPEGKKKVCVPTGTYRREKPRTRSEHHHGSAA